MEELESSESSSPSPAVEKFLFSIIEVYPPSLAAPSLPLRTPNSYRYFSQLLSFPGNAPLSPESRCLEVRKLGYSDPERKSNLQLGSNAIPDQ